MLNLAKFLYRQRVRGFDPPAPEPFMDPEGTERFRRELEKATYYLEYGSGGTTLLADQRNIPAISVENDRFYARAVASQLKGSCVRQIVVSTGPTREWGFPLFRSFKKARAYVDAGADAWFPDLVLVDGRWRVACALETARRAKLRGRKATLMFDDYAGRPHYHRVEHFLGKPEMAGRVAIFQIGHQDVANKDV